MADVKRLDEELYDYLLHADFAVPITKLLNVFWYYGYTLVDETLKKMYEAGTINRSIDPTMGYAWNSTYACFLNTSLSYYLD